MDPASVTARRERAVLAGLARFCDDEGVEVDDIANALLVEAFCAKGLAGRATSTQGTYRSVLRQLAAKPQRFSPSVPHAGAPASAPYTGAERAELWSMARHQRSGWRRHSALVVLALGLGAGMRPGEIIAARSEDLLGGRGRIAVAV